MLYELQTPYSFDGKTDFIDLSNYLHRFLHMQTVSVGIRFRTENAGYQSLFAIYYKESLLPDFALELHKGRATLIARRHGEVLVRRGAEAYCDGAIHELSFRGSTVGVEVWMDGQLVIADKAPGPYCEFGYVGFATVGRGVCEDSFANFFHGEILSLRISEELLAPPRAGKEAGIQKFPLFCKGMRGAENFRIPTILTTKNGVTIASADARMDAPGDNPNHICRAVRLSRDSGDTWTYPRILFDFGGEGRTDGAAAIDGSLLYDGINGVVFMLYSHTSAGIGGAVSQAGTGFDANGRKLLWDSDGREYCRAADGTVLAPDGEPTAYSVSPYGKILCGEKEIGSICHGSGRLFRHMNTSFLHLIRSEDDGETWSAPEELNPQVKEEWMKFIGAGPGTGLQLREGPYRGRLIYPVYFTGRDAKASSSAVIYSDDFGRTWKRGASVNDGRDFEGRTLTARCVDDPRAGLGECQAVELPGGRLKIFLRNSMGKRTLTAVSGDGGETWNAVEQQEALPDPECQSHVLRTRWREKDVYLFSNPESETSRVRGTVKFSSDGTDTWTSKRLLEPGEFGYSCMTQLPDGQIGILYEGSDITQYFAKFPVEWVLGASPE